MRVTVVICTLNRAQSLRRTLGSLAAMAVPAEVEWEVIVVNNGSTDDTDAVIAAFAGRLPIRREFEPQRGLSRARNRAVAAAKGDYILWTDDDVVVALDWLAAYVEAFRRRPEAAVFGGRITPRYDVPPPKWFAESEELLGWMLAKCDYGAVELPFSEYRLPLGPNFAVRAAEQRRFRYNPELGHGPAQKRRGEELDVIERILKSGAVGFWVPQAKVEHYFSPKQLTIASAVRYYATVGETFAWNDSSTSVPGVWWLGAPRWLWRHMIEEWLLYRLHRWLSPAPIWVGHLKAYALAWGKIRYWRSQCE